MGVTESKISWRRRAEMIALFVGIPLAYLIGVRPPDAVLLPLLLSATTAAIVLLWRDTTFDRAELTRWPSARRELPSTLILLAVGVVALPALAWVLVPEHFFFLPRHRPVLFVVIVLVYPIFSVLPQEILWRTFFFTRYRSILRNPLAIILASAITFAWLHILFMNWVAIALTFAGGLIFAWRYHRTRSLPFVCLEHTLWGTLIFATGLGKFFIHGTLAAVLHFVK